MTTMADVGASELPYEIAKDISTTEHPLIKG
jgi:hypothetical protein